MNLSEARARYGRGANLFSRMCYDLLKSIKTFSKMYDCILIDEAQDFDKPFMQLCLKTLDDKKRLVYAYDELQKLNEEAMPNPEEIFGQGIENDTPLTVCYRNQGNAIVTAHAIGMGLYSKDGLLQLPGSSTVWEAIGYVSDEIIEEGKEVTLYRTKETSPELLKVDPDDIIQFLSYEDSKNMNLTLLDMLRDDLEKEELLPRDILIIDMDTFDYSNNRQKLATIQAFASDPDEPYDSQQEYDFNIHAAGASNPEDFFRDNSIVYSSVRRAKGNETFMVYIVNAQKCVSSLQRRSDRNGLFTAITRSKGWVRVLGYGKEMDLLKEEFNEIKRHNFKLHFESYPTKEEQKQIFLNNQDLKAKDVQTLGNTRALINKLTENQNISKAQIMQELFGVTKEELAQLLKEMESE